MVAWLPAVLCAGDVAEDLTAVPQVSELGGVPLMLKAADMSNTIPDERVVITYVSYMCARLLDLREETRAARIIQLAWRRLCLRRSAQLRQVGCGMEGEVLLALKKSCCFYASSRKASQNEVSK